MKKDGFYFKRIKIQVDFFNRTLGRWVVVL